MYSAVFWVLLQAILDIINIFNLNYLIAAL